MGKIKRKFTEMSLKKSLIIIFTVFIIIILLLTVITVLSSVNIQRNVLDTRTLSIELTDIQRSPDGSLSYQIEDDIEWNPLTFGQQAAYYGSIAVMIILPLIYIIAGILIFSTIYYRIKLKNPINILTFGIENITNNNLDFTLDYDYKDELGRLCTAMETMRAELRRDKKHIWELLEERKAINVSVSHDLGTPITVIKGYLSYLQKKAAQGNIENDDLLETLLYMTEATGRLERYIDSVRDIQKLEDIEIYPQDEQLTTVVSELKSNLIYLAENHQKQIIVEEKYSSQLIKIDKQIFFRIMENITDNALRYAKSIVRVTISYSEGFLEACVEDDGEGFTEKSLDTAADLSYVSKDKKNHFGLGLPISKILCEKHGGQLKVGNHNNGGGHAYATIKII